MLAQRTEPLRIERQQMLQAQNGISKQATDQTKEQHRQRVLFPTVFLLVIHSHQAIGQSFQRTQQGIEPGPAVGVEHLHEIEPQRLRNCRERDDVENELKPIRSLHGASLKFFRPNHGHEQIDEQQQRDNAHDEVFHGLLLQFFAEANVIAGEDKERDDDSDEDDVTHKDGPRPSQGAEPPATSGRRTTALHPARRGAPGTKASAAQAIRNPIMSIHDGTVLWFCALG
jgi:hypothetical protein